MLFFLLVFKCSESLIQSVHLSDVFICLMCSLTNITQVITSKVNLINVGVFYTIIVFILTYIITIELHLNLKWSKERYSVKITTYAISDFVFYYCLISHKNNFISVCQHYMLQARQCDKGCRWCTVFQWIETSQRWYWFSWLSSRGQCVMSVPVL